MYGKEQTGNLKRFLQEKNLDALVLVSYSHPFFDPYVYYFTGLQGYEGAIAVLAGSNKVYVPGFEVDRARKDSWITSIQERPYEKVFETVLKSLKGKRVGVHGYFLSMVLSRKIKKAGVQLIDVTKELQNLRAVKTKEEISYLKKAVKLSKEMHALADVKKLDTEISTTFGVFAAEQGAEMSYDPIVAFDGNAANPHAVPLGKKGKRVLMIDAAVKYRGYGADITRSYLIKKDRKLQRAYEVVEEAQKRAIDMIAPGVKCSDVDKVARDYLEKNGFDLIHATGHGIGLQVHEKPTLGHSSTSVLEEGNVVTVEPAVYVKNQYGIRIEDDILVTKKGRKIL